jgi:hypothetical protein
MKNKLKLPLIILIAIGFIVGIEQYQEYQTQKTAEEIEIKKQETAENDALKRECFAAQIPIVEEYIKTLHTEIREGLLLWELEQKPYPQFQLQYVYNILKDVRLLQRVRSVEYPETQFNPRVLQQGPFIEISDTDIKKKVIIIKLATGCDSSFPSAHLRLEEFKDEAAKFKKALIKGDYRYPDFQYRIVITVTENGNVERFITISVNPPEGYVKGKVPYLTWNYYINPMAN